MDRNPDPRFVVLDKDMYERLHRLARIGAAESNDLYGLKRVNIHARKFNLALAQRASDERQHLHATRRELIFQTKNFVKRNQGKVVYQRLQERILRPVYVVGRNPNNKLAVRLVLRSPQVRDKRERVFDAFLTALTDDPNPEWERITLGPYAGCYTWE